MSDETHTIRLSYSPDADDAFMFWGLLHGKLDTEGYVFSHVRADTERLNAGAEAPDAPDVTAVSIHQYAYLGDRYLLLPHGGSVGVGYGPVVVARRPMSAADLRGARIGVPGLRTTAYLALRLLQPDFEAVPVPVAPFSRAFDALDRGEVDAVTMIHEGRLLYEARGLHCVLELGQTWQERTGLPLPLGGNVIRRGLGERRIADVSRILRRSIAWALDHREEVVRALVREETREGVPRDATLFDRYLAMYANQDTLDYGEQGRQAILTILRQGHEAGIIPHPVALQFAP